VFVIVTAKLVSSIFFLNVFFNRTVTVTVTVNIMYKLQFLKMFVTVCL